MTASNNIPIDIALYLDEIAKRLWSGHATIMVGAGFSKNASKAIASAPNFPSWHELSDCFYKKLNGKVPDEKTNHYLNPLKLAEEVQSAFGRPVLDQLLRACIPDKEYEPSDLHIRLLEFPWVDIFTVNYDTLLERASEKITSRRFDVVVNKDDLVYSTRPRIIKLHGSFPSSRPFIITEEDYRCYPKEHAPFVNTVQQSLLENTLCMIGFSAEDPNFLNWIGWVRDNLGKSNSPKMYLVVGAHSLTAAQKKILEDRCVVLVDMTQCPEVGRDHRKAVACFFDYLKSKKPTSSVQWPSGKNSVDFSDQKSIDELTEKFRNQRKSYPNWIIAPESSRSILLRTLPSRKAYEYLMSPSPAIMPPQDINLLYELNWRYERALHPVPSELAIIYESILNRYSPYHEWTPFQNAEVRPNSSEFMGLNWKEIGMKWLSLKLSLLRFNREEGFFEKWQNISTGLGKLIHYMSPEQIAWLFYERCLCALFLLDLNKLKEQIVAWPVNIALPFWEAKRASLLAELGDITEAKIILERSLVAIRANQQLTPVINDFTWVSQESHVMYLIRLLDFSRRIFSGEDAADQQQFTERWNELKQYKCDPWLDLKLFDLNLKVLPDSPTLVTKTRKFDVDEETTAHHFASDISLEGYAFLRFCEEAGLPFVLGTVNVAKPQALKSAKLIAPYSSGWALVTLLRIGEVESANFLFDRITLARMSVQRIDELVDRFTALLQKLRDNKNKGGDLTDKNLASRITYIIPEILSRLCTKCSPDRSDEIFRLIKELYCEPVWDRFDGVRDLIKRLLNSWSIMKQYEKIPELLIFPTIKNEALDQSFPEPFHFLKLSKEATKKIKIIPNIEETINCMIDKVKLGMDREREQLGIRLAFVYQWGFLSDAQEIALSEAFWTQTGTDGFPSKTRFFKYFFLKLPAPPKIDVIGLFKKYVRETALTNLDANMGVTLQKSGKPPIGFTGGHIRICSEILGATRRSSDEKGVEWTVEEIIQMLNKLVEWWNEGKTHLLESFETSPFGEDIPSEFRARYRNLVEIIAQVIAPFFITKNNLNSKRVLEELLDDFRRFKMPALQAEVACLSIFPEKRNDVLIRIIQSMTMHADQIVLWDSLMAVTSFSRIATMQESEVLLRTVSQQIKWRRDDNLRTVMDVMKSIIEEFPERLTKDVLEDILLALEGLISESEIQGVNISTDATIRVSHRYHAAGLAFALFRHYGQKGEPIPGVLFRWREICTNSEEFLEIRNQWDELL